jgi:hypothetical protein
MKKLLIVFSLFLNAINFMYSQDVYDVVANETCECINSKVKDLSKISSETLQTEMGMCILQSYSKNVDKMKGKFKVDLDDEEGMTKFGEKIGIKMLGTCPDVILKFGKDEIQKEDISNKLLENLKIEGEFIEQVNNEFTSITIKDDTGRTHTFLLLTFFENSNLITDNLMKKGSKVIAEYNEQEYYDAKVKDYRRFKILKAIQKI